MSHVMRHPLLSEDSAADRARLNERLEALRSTCEARHRDDASMRRTLTIVQFLGVLVALLLTTLIGGGRWIVKHAVADALIESGVIVTVPRR